MIIIVLIIGLILGLYIIASYNSMVKSRVLVEEAWSGIEVQLKRRYDLIPNLVETVKGYSTHEKQVFQEVVSLRTQSQQATTITERSQLEQGLSTGIGRLMAVAEAYPELKADQNFRQLQDQLGGIEEDIQSSRRYYNGAVRNFNMLVQTFPTVLIAGPLGFQSRDFFEIGNDAERATPSVKF